MGNTELPIWIKYRSKYGPMNDVRRFDRPLALLIAAVRATAGLKTSVEDFMPYGKEPVEQTPGANLDEIIAAFGGVNIGKPR